jgi:type I restriction enzyme, S subunit
VSHLPDGWTLATLGDVCQKPQYGWTTRARRDGAPGLHLLRTTDIAPGAVEWSGVPFCQVEPPDPEKYLVRDGDLVVSRAGSVGVSLRIRNPQPSVFASYLIRFRPLAGIDTDYLGWFLKSPGYWRQIEEASAGIALQNVNARKLAAVTLPVPPLAEQQRIVAAIEEQFSRLDAGVAATEHVRTYSKKLRAAVLEEAVAGSLVPGARTAPAMPVSQLVTFLDQGWSPRCENRPSEDDRDWAVIKTTAVQSMRFDEGANKRLPETLHPRPDYELATGDLLITRAGPRSRVGVCCLVRSVRPRLMICDKVYRFRTNNEVALPKYVELALNAPSVTRRVNNIKTGISDSGVNITQKSFLALQLPVPALDVQSGIIDAVHAHLSRIDALDQSVVAAATRADRFRSSILSAAFAGELVSPADGLMSA